MSTDKDGRKKLPQQPKDAAVRKEGSPAARGVPEDAVSKRARKDAAHQAPASNPFIAPRDTNDLEIYWRTPRLAALQDQLRSQVATGYSCRPSPRVMQSVERMYLYLVEKVLDIKMGPRDAWSAETVAIKLLEVSRSSSTLAGHLLALRQINAGAVKTAIAAARERRRLKGHVPPLGSSPDMKEVGERGIGKSAGFRTIVDNHERNARQGPSSRLGSNAPPRESWLVPQSWPRLHSETHCPAGLPRGDLLCA